MPLQLNAPSERPFEEIPYLGLAIKRSGNFIHVGFLYRDEASQIRLSHLAFHHIFRGSDVPSDDFFWLEPQLNEMVCEVISSFLIHVAEEIQPGEIPYSILYRGKQIDASGKYITTGTGNGLTCATYVLEIFSALEMPLLDLPTWPTGRLGDTEWAEEILNMLRSGPNPASEEHIVIQRAELPNIVRYRPEEVGTGFAMFKNTPQTFTQIESTSGELVAQLA